MEAVQLQKKIKLLFEKIVEPNYVLDNYYADNLINKLSSSIKDPEISFLETLPLMSDLVIDAIDRTQNSHISVKVFLTRLFAINSYKELCCAKMLAKKGDKFVAAFNEINSPTMSPSLRVAYVEVALGLVTHNSGISWLLETGVWKEILSLCNDKQTVFVARKTYKFVSKFLWKLNDLGDEANIRSVLNFILKPFNTIDFIKIESMTQEVEDDICKAIEPMLNMLLSVVSDDNRIERHSSLITILHKECQVTTHLLIVLERLRREDVVLIVSKLIFWLVLSRVFLAKPQTLSPTYDMSDFIELTVIYFNAVQHLIQKRCATLLLDYCNACNIIWSTVFQDKNQIKWDREGKIVKLHHQLLIMCLVPSLVYVKSVGKLSQLTYEYLDEYMVKLLNWSCEHTAKAAYAFRDLTLELDTLSITLQSVKRLTCLKNHLNNEQANIVFQAMFYVLKEYDPVDDQGHITNEDYEVSQEKVLVMTYVLDTVLLLVKNHNINWQESLEVLCLYNVVYNILQRPNLSCKFVMTALNLIALTVKKFLPPNLSLLLESRPGSAMYELGKLIYMKMHDLNWEVRDSALELLLVCIEISYIKFTPFQKQIMENNLVNVAATIAMNDHEYYVQTSALRCIGAASKVNSIWEQLISQFPNIEEVLISILCNNQEGIVRKEACNILCDLYQNLKLSPSSKQRLYEHMVYSALSDFHWEVQLSALKFWRITIQSLLTDQGMLDGTFPPVTFSRETRKIVTLNEAEIQRRLLRILDELASIGCLTVLVKLLHEDTEVAIMDSALSISLELLDILNKYKVPELLKPSDTTDLNDVNELEFIKKENGECVMEDIAESEMSIKADHVIESILNVADINLLSNLYDSHMTLNNELHNEVSTIAKIKLQKLAMPNLFITFLNSKDFKTLIEQKRKWKDGIKSLPSLLDDILGVYEVNNEINSLDCY